MSNTDKRDRAVLEMLRMAHHRVEVLHQPVDFHKRYDRNDVSDPYGSVIEWVHETGAWLFGPFK